MTTNEIKEIIKEREDKIAKTNPQYGRVYFSLRKRFGISIKEALLLDVISILSRKTGWCFASQKYLAFLFGISERQLRRMVSNLKEKNLLESNSKYSGQLRSSAKWTL